MAKEVIVTGEKVRHRRKMVRIVKLSLLLLLLLLIVIYVILQIIYNVGSFTVTLDSNKTLQSGISIYDNLNDPTAKRKLEAEQIKFMDNISYKWLPADIDGYYDGSHNGTNYLAFTFFIENQGDEELNYWYEVIQDDVIKNVDEAIRIRIYLNGQETTYAKKNALANEPEDGTTAFTDNKDSLILEERQNFSPGTVDKMTIVVWLEGDDPDCVDSLIGGEIKMHMNITEEHMDEEGE